MAARGYEGVMSESMPPVRRSPIVRYAPALLVVFCILAVIVMAVVSPFESPPPSVRIDDALVGSDNDPTGAYMVIRNPGGPDELLAASSPAATSVDLQQATSGGAPVTVDQLAVPGFDDLRLQPGSDQLLLRGLVAPLVVGQRIPIVLEFRRSGTITVEAEVATYDTIAKRLLPPRLKLAGE